jgi:hypothetical protein
VIAVDTNILVYAHRADSEWHDRATASVTELAEGVRSWAIPWPCIHEFLATVTHPRIFRTPTTVTGALGQVEAWLESPSLVVLSESDIHFDALRDVISTSRAVGPRVHDARVAALCLVHGVRELWSADRDFSMFPSLRVRNPLVTSGHRL